MNYHGHTANRKTISFGYDYNFDNNQLTKGENIPSEFDPFIQKVAYHLSIAQNQFIELLVTEYAVGTVINWHRDAMQFNLIAGISLLADCTFRLRPYEKSKQTKATIISFPVQRRSLYIIQGNARWNWQHSIAPVKQKRYSLTLRTMKR